MTLCGRYVLGTMAAALVSIPAPAIAQEDTPSDRLQLSLDGTTYSASLPGPVFADPPLLVPGESATDRIWALNASAEPAVLSVYVVDLESSLPADVSVTDDFRVGGGVPGGETSGAPAADLDPCTPIAQAELGAGEDAPLALWVALPVASGNVSQRESLSLDFAVDLRSADAPGTRCDPPTPTDPVEQRRGDAGSSSPEGPLPRTGSDVEPLLLAALLALLAGVSLRRLGRQDPPDPARS